MRKLLTLPQQLIFGSLAIIAICAVVATVILATGGTSIHIGGRHQEVEACFIRICLFGCK